MKKRSLFAAVAMLIVSAIVLTSATYAWFAAGTTTTVNSITASVSNTDGSLLVSSDNSKWKLELTPDELGYAASGNVLQPVDFRWSGDETSPIIKKVEFDGFKFSAATDATSSDYIAYTFYVKAGTAGKIDLKPAFTSATEGKNFVYGYVIVDGTTGYKFASAGSDSYAPLAESYTGADDANNNSVVDSAEGAVANTVEITKNPEHISISTTAEQVHTINVYVWAEGQDTGCAGTVSANGNGFSFAPEFAQGA